MFAPLLGLRRCRWPVVVFWSATAWAQNTPWPEANQNAAQHPRGHIDILRWEQAQDRLRPTRPPVAATPWNLEDATRAAQAQRPGLLHTPGLGSLDLAQRQQAAQAVALQVHNAWYRAVAAQQTLGLQQTHAEAAEAGAELGQRMVQVGNWSEAKGLQTQLNHLDAQVRLAQARAAADTTRTALWQLTGGPGGQVVLPEHLPAELPPLPQTHLVTPPGVLQQLEKEAKAAHPSWRWSEQAAQQALQGLSLDHRTLALEGPTRAWTQTAPVVGTAWTHPVAEAARLWADHRALERHIQGSVRLALTQWQHNHQLASSTQAQAQGLRERVQEETLLRYNGMLASTWDLLGAAQNRLLAQQTGVQAQLNAWLAWGQLEGVRRGLPYNGPDNSANNPTPSNTPSAGH